MARFAAQACAVAFGAGLGAAVAREVFAHHGRVRVTVAPRHVGQDALEGVLLDDGLALVRAAVQQVAEGDLFLTRAVQDDLAHAFGQLLEGRLHIKAVMPRQALQHGEVVAVAPIPALDGAAGEADGRESHHARGVEHLLLAQAVARGAGARRRVEREQARLQLRQRVAANRAGELAGKQVLLARVHLQRQYPAVALVPAHPQGGLDAFGQALLGVGAHLQAVDHHVDVVLLGLLELGQAFVLVDLPVHAKAHVAQRLHLHEQLGELTLLLARHRRQQHELGVLGQGQHRIHHLAHGLRRQRQAVVRAVRRARAREQQAQVVVDLGHRAHGGARVVAGGLLLDGNGRRQTLDQVHIGLVQPPQELPRIGRQALHIAALPFGIQRIERQAGLARARQPGDHHELVARDVQVDVLEVVRARPADADALLAQDLRQWAPSGRIGRRRVAIVGGWLEGGHRACLEANAR